MGAKDHDHRKNSNEEVRGVLNSSKVVGSESITAYGSKKEDTQEIYIE